jgi:nicotinamide riboside kinase
MNVRSDSWRRSYEQKRFKQKKMSEGAVIVNIIGGPGAGKTTLAAMLFAFMKQKYKDCRVEYVQEYAKKLVWREDWDVLNNQLIVSKKQYELFHIMKDKVDVIVTDGPLVHGLYYNKTNVNNTSHPQKTEEKIIEYINEFRNINIVINRGDFTFETAGRTQTEEEAIEIDNGLRQLLKSYNIDFTTFDVTQVDDIIQHVATEANLSFVN